MSRSIRRAMIDRDHQQLSLVRQCILLDVSRPRRTTGLRHNNNFVRLFRDTPGPGRTGQTGRERQTNKRNKAIKRKSPAPGVEHTQHHEKPKRPKNYPQGAAELPSSGRTLLNAHHCPQHQHPTHTSCACGEHSYGQSRRPLSFRLSSLLPKSPRVPRACWQSSPHPTTTPPTPPRAIGPPASALDTALPKWPAEPRLQTDLG